MRTITEPMIHRLYDKVNVTLSFPVQAEREVRDTFQIESGKDYDYKITKHKNKRSLDANAYAWVLIGKLAERQNLTISEVYREQIKELPTYTIICLKTEAKDSFVKLWESKGVGWVCDEFDSKIDGCTNIKAHYGSSAFDTKEMSQLIDNLIHECSIQHIPINEQEIYESLERWK